MSIHVLIPSAGSGSRLGADAPKQYLELAGASVLSHTVAAFEQVARVDTINVVVQPADARAAELLGVRERLRIAPVGGPSRAASVLGGLRWLQQQGAMPSDWVLVHDAARCCVTPEAVAALLEACLDHAVGGLLALPLPDTLKRGADGQVAATLARTDLWLAQTPQMFRLALLEQALGQGDLAAITDEASAVEQLGLQPLLVQGSSSNFKVTYPADLELAEALLQARARNGGQHG